MNCIECGISIPKRRLEVLPNTKKCVNCSDVGKKVGTPITLGNGDHTYTELEITDADEYEKMERLRRRYES